MLTIENVDRINKCIGFDTWTVVADTHYTFYINVNGTKLEVTLSRHKPKYQYGKPHPQSDKYLLQCHHSTRGNLPGPDIVRIDRLRALS